MEKKKTEYTVLKLQMLALASLILALVGLILRTVALFTSFEPESSLGYFKETLFFPGLLYAVEALGFILLLVFCFYIRKKGVPARVPELESAMYAGRMIAAVGALVAAVLAAMSVYGVSSVPAFVPALAMIFLSLGAMYFLLPIFFDLKKETRLYLGYALILGAAFLISLTYFDRYTKMNAPHKLSVHIGLLAVMCATLFDLRVIIGAPKPRLSAVLTALAVFAPVMYGGSNVIAYLFGVYHDLTYFGVDLFLLTFGIFSAVKQAGIFLLSPEAETSPADIPTEAAVPSEATKSEDETV